jgi:hypothetical protein
MKKNPATKSRFVLSLMVYLLVACCLLLADVYADTHTAASCSRTDVQNAINAASDGDTVLIPAGSATWQSSSPRIPAVSIDKGIVLKGAGMDSTVITDGNGMYSYYPWNEGLVWVYGEEGKPVRITGIGFKSSYNAQFIRIEGTCKDWRIDHCKFETTHYEGGYGAFVSEHTYGVIDHNICSNVEFHVTEAYGELGIGDDSWDRPLALGTANAVYIEDCTMVFDYENNDAVDGQGGGRFVFRYNTITNSCIHAHGRDSGGVRSTFSYEAYENTIISESDLYRSFYMCGGTGVLFNNTVTGSYSIPDIHVTNVCSCTNEGSSSAACRFSKCYTYPCTDQIGRSTNQSHEPLYEWNNTINGENMDISLFNYFGCSTIEGHIQENRDFYNDTQRPGYTPYVYPHPLVSGDPSLPPDTTPPDNIVMVNDGTASQDIDSTSSTTQLSANWTPSADGESSISKYWYAIGTTAGGTDTAEWTSTSNGTVTSVTRSGLSLTIGITYYFTVKAENGVSLQSNSTSSDGQLVGTGGGTSPGEDEIDAKVYPNPYTPSEGNTMTFSVDGTPGGDVKIYTISGNIKQNRE